MLLPVLQCAYPPVLINKAIVSFAAGLCFWSQTSKQLGSGWSERGGKACSPFPGPSALSIPGYLTILEIVYISPVLPLILPL